MKATRARDADAPAAADRETERARIREGLLYCLKVFLGLRVGLFVLALLGLGVLPIRADAPLPLVPGWPLHPVTPGFHNMFTAFEREDALWFLRIAVGGYSKADGSAAFFPLYPLLIRGVSFLIGGHPLAASLIVSNGSFFGALVILYFLTSSELSEDAARRTVLYISVFPTAFFFLAPYSESTFLLLSVGSFWAARRGKWPLAGVAGALAAATRNFGLFLAPALAVEALHQWWELRGARPRESDPTRSGSSGAARPGPGFLIWRLLWSGAVGLGTLGYFLFWKAFGGNFFAPVGKQADWSRRGTWPWTSLWHATKFAFQQQGTYYFGYFLLDWLIVVPVILLAAYGITRLRPGYSTYVWLSILAPLSFPFPSRPLLSMPRFAAVLFPAFWSLAILSERRRVPHHLVVGVSAAGLGLMTVLFVNWYYVF